MEKKKQHRNCIKEQGKQGRHTFLDGLDFGAGEASGVDGLVILLGAAGGGLLAYDHRLPVPRDRTNSCHLRESSRVYGGEWR